MRTLPLSALIFPVFQASAELVWSPGGSADGAESRRAETAVFLDGAQAVPFATGEDLCFRSSAVWRNKSHRGLLFGNEFGDELSLTKTLP